MEQNESMKKKKKKALVVLTVFWIAAAIAVFAYLSYSSTHISTDDAFVEGSIHTIAFKVPGTVKAVHVSDNQKVKKGDLLVEMESSDYEVKTAEARANMEVEKARLSEARARLDASRKQHAELKYGVSAAKANVEAALAGLRQADADLKRAEGLVKDGTISEERLEKAKTAYDVSAARLKAANEQLLQAGAAVASQTALIGQYEAAVKTAEAAVGLREEGVRASELTLGYTKLYAPSDGYVARKSVQTGNQVQPGQPLMAVVALDEVWVTANYKETQLGKIKPGMKVVIEADAYPGGKLTGRVDSIMAGTGSVFSLFPPENATGNFVKVVQRVPVKITIDKGSDPGGVLRVGMSVVPTVLIEK